jgi:hypothetical protein
MAAPKTDTGVKIETVGVTRTEKWTDLNANATGEKPERKGRGALNKKRKKSKRSGKGASRECERLKQKSLGEFAKQKTVREDITGEIQGHGLPATPCWKRDGISPTTNG